MTDKRTAFKFVIVTTVVVALGILISPSALRYFVPIDQAQAIHSVGSSQIDELPSPQLSRVRLLVSNMK
jgi:hypothetical protein